MKAVRLIGVDIEIDRETHPGELAIIGADIQLPAPYQGIVDIVAVFRTHDKDFTDGGAVGGGMSGHFQNDDERIEMMHPLFRLEPGRYGVIAGGTIGGHA